MGVALDSQPVEAVPGRRWVKVLLLVVVLALVAMWVYAFFLAPRGGVNPVHDQAWQTGAEAVCAKAETSLQPIKTDQSVLTLPQYVANLDQVAVIFDTMLVDLDAVPRTSAKAQVLVPQWLADYRTWVSDLRAWTNKLRQGNRPPFGVTVVGGIPIDEKINTFAAENRITSCEIANLNA